MARVTTGEQVLWKAVLDDLQLQMAQATFNTWLRGSEVIGRENGRLRVSVKHPHAVAWLSNRLLPMIVRTAKRHDATVKDVEFISGLEVGATAAGDVAIDEPQQDDVPDSGDVDVETFIPPELAAFNAEEAGYWSKLANYAMDFWAELLGPVPFLTWLAIKRDDVRKNARRTAWTPRRRFSVSKLARKAAGGNNQAITGVWRTCRSRAMLDRGEPCEKCEERGGHVEDGVCRYWRPGAFDILQREGVAIVQRLGEGMRTVYRVRVFNVLPLLTPRQVGRLNPLTQEKHEKWLLDHALDLEQWERLTVDHLVLEQLDNIH